LISAALLVASSALVAYGSRALRSSARRGSWPVRIALLLAIPLLIGSLAVELHGQWQVGLRPTESGYGATVYAIAGMQGLLVFALTIMGFYTIARSLAGLLNAERRATYDNTMLLWHYTVGQGLVALFVVHVSPRILA
jgi:cytochrome c oxidase subunit I+III